VCGSGKCNNGKKSRSYFYAREQIANNVKKCQIHEGLKTSIGGSLKREASRLETRSVENKTRSVSFFLRRFSFLREKLAGEPFLTTKNEATPFL